MKNLVALALVTALAARDAEFEKARTEFKKSLADPNTTPRAIADAADRLAGLAEADECDTFHNCSAILFDAEGLLE